MWPFSSTTTLLIQNDFIRIPVAKRVLRCGIAARLVLSTIVSVTHILEVEGCFHARSS